VATRRIWESFLNCLKNTSRKKPQAETLLIC
jgi:hypothetical protein